VINDSRHQGLTHLLPLARPELRQVLESMLLALGLEHCTLDLELVSDARMSRLNQEFLGCVGPTNVLSFSALDSKNADHAEADVRNAGKHLGQLILAPETVRREAFLYGQPLEPHTLRLLAHGLTHLAGHDHGPLMDALVEEALDAGLCCLHDTGAGHEAG
jgi:probable rRNA maturation factor